MFVDSNTWMIEKNSMKHHYQRNNVFIDGDYTNIVNKDFEIKNSCKYHDLYVQNDTLLLTDVYNNFWNICLEMYEMSWNI